MTTADTLKRIAIKLRSVHFILSLRNSYTEFHGTAPSKLPTIGLLGVVAHPLYYVVWAEIFPQPYESLTLRLSAAALCVPIAVRSRWPRRIARYYLAYCYFALLLAGPAFFTFMLLMNGDNSVWLMSTTAILLFTMLLYDFANAIVVTTAGSMLAVSAFWSLGGASSVLAEYLLLFPVFAFILSAVAFLSHSQSLISEDRLLAARAFASSVAHEMRTPLLGIRFDAELLDALLTSPSADGAAGHRLAPRDATQMSAWRPAALAATSRIREQVNSANLVIDMLLVNLRQTQFGGEHLESCLIGETVNKALDRYPFQTGEREMVSVHLDDNFHYRGVQVLMVHVIYNLLKNALRAVASAGGGHIAIRAVNNHGRNTITVTDTGHGIDPAVLPFVFIPFVTGNAEMSGSGVGLAFCRRVVEGMGGRISCESEPASGTTFSILLPSLAPETGPQLAAEQTPPPPLAS